MSQLHPYGHGGDIRTAAGAAGFSPDEIMDFSANINPLGPPPGLLPFLADHLPSVTAYPDPACRRLCDAIRGRYRPQHDVVPGNGAGELIYLLMRVLPAGPVLLPAPTFTLYGKAALAAGREISYHFLQQCEGFRLDVSSFCRRIRSLRPALVVLCNPNNPTGTLLEKKDLLDVAAACRNAGACLAVDEAFLEFSPHWRELTLLTEAPDNTLILCSLTKLYAIPGLRLGFLAAPAALARALCQLRDPWSVNTLAQLAGEYVLSESAFAKETARETSRLALNLFHSLSAIPGLRPFAPAANYIFLESTSISSHTLQQRLLQKKVLVRDCGNYAGLEPRFIRVAVRRDGENDLLLRALQTVSEEVAHEVHFRSSR